MLYSELLDLTDGQATYEQYLEIDKAYMAKEGMTKQQAAALWKRRHGPKVDKPRPKEMRLIKEAIRDFWNEHEWACTMAERVSQQHKDRIEQYKADCAGMPEAHINYTIERFEQQRQKAVWDMWESFGNDTTIHLIYKDGSEAIYSGAELVSHDVPKPKMQHIAYACLLDGWQEYDTLTGELEWDEQDGDETGDEWFERREAYMNMVQFKYGTEWAKRMIEKYGEGVATA